MNKLITALLIIAISSPLLLSCAKSKDDIAKDAVREYLKKKGVNEFEEELWGKLDSVFSPFNMETSYSLIKSSINKDIALHELTISELNFNRQKNRARIKELKDSVMLLQDSLESINAKYYKALGERKNNRLGIFLKLKYKNLIGAEKTRSFTFVFNQFGDELSVGHHLDEYGNVCD